MKNSCLKLRKIALFLLFLAPMSPLMATKTYFRFKGRPSEVTKKVANVFDVGILLESVGSGGLSCEEKEFFSRKIRAVTNYLRGFIKDEEAVIVSAAIMRNLISIVGASIDKEKKEIEELTREIFTEVAKDSKIEDSKIKDSKIEDLKISKLATLQVYVEIKLECEEAFKDLFTDAWSIFMTNDCEFVVLIPRAKYRTVNRRQDLLKLGLNPAVLRAIHSYSKKIYDEKKLLEFLRTQKSRYEIPLNSLFAIFSDDAQAKKVNKRMMLVGHGSESEVANLTRGPGGQFRKFRSMLDKKGCSFLFIITCYGGGTVRDDMTLNMFMAPKKTKKPLSSKKFIEVVQGAPGHIVSCFEKTRFNDFFYRVNRFLKAEMEEYKRYLVTQQDDYEDGEDDDDFEKRKQKFSDVYKKFDQVHEQGMICGEYCVSGKNYKDKALIKRDKKIKKSLWFERIFEVFFKDADARDIPSCRFPEDKKMTTISGATKNVVQKISYDDVKDLKPGDIFKIKPGVTDVFIETTIINGTLEIDADYPLPRLHPSIFGCSHHFIEKIVLKYTKEKPSKGKFLDENVMPNKYKYDKAFFIGKLSDQGPGKTCSFENVFYFKDKDNEKTLYRKFFGQKKYKALTCVSCIAKRKKKEYTRDSDIKNVEIHLLRLMGFAKPSPSEYKRGESHVQSLSNICSGMKLITKFTTDDLGRARETSKNMTAGELRKGYDFQRCYIEFHFPLNHQYIFYPDVKDLSSGKEIKVRPGVTDVFLYTTAIDGTLEIDADYPLPRIHPAISGCSHHFIRKVVLKYTKKKQDLLKFLDESVMPFKYGYNRAFFISELCVQGPGETCSFENVCYFKDEKNKKTLCRKVYGEKKYEKIKNVFRLVGGEKREYQGALRIKDAEYNILKLMGLAKPSSDQYKWGESPLTSMGAMSVGIKFLSKFTRDDLDYTEKKAKEAGSEVLKEAYQFRADFINWKL